MEEGTGDRGSGTGAKRLRVMSNEAESETDEFRWIVENDEFWRYNFNIGKKV
jgi:hypothetical protein